MVSRGSKVELLDGSGLVLTDPQGTRVWSSISVSNLAYGFMNDTGNFVLVGSDSHSIWESFDSFADTMLPTQDGNLVLNSRDISSGYTYKAYYISNTYDASNSTNSGDQLIFDATGLLHILKRNGERSELTPKDALPSGDYYHRATLGFDGVFTQYYYPKNSDGNTSWSISLLEPANIWLLLIDPCDPYGDCKLNFTPSCEEDLTYSGEIDFVELTSIDWPQSDYVHMESTSVDERKDFLHE
ncbi:G-type lectin S-receptor-like serine/threonine-protein kinase LECRK3 [Tanacetum coccineum]